MNQALPKTARKKEDQETVVFPHLCDCRGQGNVAWEKPQTWGVKCLTHTNSAKERTGEKRVINTGSVGR